MTQQQLTEIKQKFTQPPRSISELQNLGMFEVFLPPKPEHQQQAIELVTWLDQHINENLIEKYLALAKSGDRRARWALERFRSKNLYN